MPATAPFPAILLVDDEPIVLAILHRLVRDLMLDYDILVASDTTTALEQIDQRMVPLVITDYQMAGINGLTFATHLKRHASTTQVVLMTGYDTPELREKAYACGVDYYLSKPFSIQALKQIVHTALA